MFVHIFDNSTHITETRYTFSLKTRFIIIIIITITIITGWIIKNVPNLLP